MSGYPEHVEGTKDDFGRAFAHPLVVQRVADGAIQTAKEGDGGGGLGLWPVRHDDVSVHCEHRHPRVPGTRILDTSKCNTFITGVTLQQYSPSVERTMDTFKCSAPTLCYSAGGGPSTRSNVTLVLSVIQQRELGHVQM